MSPYRVCPIVEGHGEVFAVPVLLRRLGKRLAPELALSVNPPLRVPRDRFLRDNGEFGRYVELAARKARPRGAVLILLDAHEDCPAVLGPELRSRACGVRSDVPVVVVIARREFEAWFIAAVDSLHRVEGLSPRAVAPKLPEEISGAKEWLAKYLPGGRYIPRLHQPAFVERLDLEAARRAPSFDKLFRELVTLLEAQVGAGDS